MGNVARFLSRALEFRTYSIQIGTRCLIYSSHMIPGSRQAVQTYKHVREVIERYERWYMPTMLIGGVAFDIWQFRVLNLREKFIVMLVYFIMVTGSMVLTASPKAEQTPKLRYFRLVAPLAQQFAMGGLLSTALLFYWFSGTFSVTWPLITLVAILMISNETLRHIVLKPMVQVGILYFALFSLFAIWFAHLFSSLSWPVFLAGGLASMTLMTLLLALLVKVAKVKNFETEKHKRQLETIKIK